MDILKNKASLYKQIVPLFINYVKKLSIAHKNLYSLMSDILSYLNKIESSINSIPGVKLDTPSNVFKSVQIVNGIENYLHYAYEKLHLNLKELPSEMSNTFLLNLGKDFEHIVVKYSVLLNDNKINNSMLMHKILPILENSTISEIDSLFAKYQNTVNLYMHYIQLKLDSLDPDDSEYTAVLKSLEDAKSRVINNADIRGKVKIQYKDLLMQRFGLIPMWQHMDREYLLQQSLSLIKYENDTSTILGGKEIPFERKLDSLSNLFKEKKRGLFVMVSMASNKIEFDYRTLIHKKISKRYTAPDNCGLNEMVLEKYDIIKDLNIDKNPSSIYKNIKLGKTDSNKWLIIRTLDGEHYDIMGYNKNKMFVGRDFIDKLERGPSLLVDTYQRICSNKLMSHLKPPQEISIDDNTPLKNVANKVISAMRVYVDKKLENPPSNLTELFEIVGGEEIEELTSNIIIRSYEKIDKKITSSSELSSTFLYNAAYVIKGFVKSVKEKLAKSDLNEFMFEEKTKNALIVHIRSRLSDIVKVSAEKAFDPQKDIYEKLMVKKSLLNIEL